MSLNTIKSLKVSFTCRRNCYRQNYILCDAEISSIDMFKYLGITFSSNLSWSSHTACSIVNEANRTLGHFRRQYCLAPPSVKLGLGNICPTKIRIACPAGDVHHSNFSIALEAFLNRAACYINSDYSYHTSKTKLESEACLDNSITSKMPQNDIAPFP